MQNFNTLMGKTLLHSFCIISAKHMVGNFIQCAIKSNIKPINFNKFEFSLNGFSFTPQTLENFNKLFHVVFPPNPIYA